MGHTGRIRNVHSWKLLNHLSNTGMQGHLWYLGVLETGAECTVSAPLQHGQEGKEGQLGVGNHRTSSPSLGSGAVFFGLALLLFLRGDNIQQAPAP
jgi:hypothetical protein